MSPNDKKIILALHQMLKNKFSDYAGLYFYGSRVKGNFQENADFDIVVTFKTKVDWKKENEVWGEIALFEMEHEIALDVRIFQDTEIRKENTPFRESVVRTGVFYGL